MRILVTGASGDLGRCVVPVLARYFTVFPFGRELDIVEIEILMREFDKIRPDVVVHFAALTDLELCEKNPGLAEDINVYGTRNIVILCEKFGSFLIFSSSPFVFDGAKLVPYSESDKPNPVNVYGRTKLEAEQIVIDSGIESLILRLGWIFGPYVSRFSNRIIREIISGGSIFLATDSFLSPLYTLDFAEFICNSILKRLKGIVHISNSGACSPYEFGLFVAEKMGAKKPLQTTFDKLKFETRRPQNFSICSETGLALRNWKEALACFLDEIKTKPYWLFY